MFNALQLYYSEVPIFKAMLELRLSQSNEQFKLFEEQTNKDIVARYAQNKDRKDAKYHNGKLYINGFFIPKDLNDIYQYLVNKIKVYEDTPEDWDCR